MNDSAAKARFVGMYAILGVAAAALGSGVFRQIVVGMILGGVTGLLVLGLWRLKIQHGAKWKWAAGVTLTSLLLTAGWSYNILKSSRMSADADHGLAWTDDEVAPERSASTTGRSSLATLPEASRPSTRFYLPPSSSLHVREGSPDNPTTDSAEQAMVITEAVCLRNTHSTRSIEYSFRWATQDWQTMLLRPNDHRLHSRRHAEEEPSPDFEVRFDSDLGEATSLTTRTLRRVRIQEPALCESAWPYEFQHSDSNLLGLVSQRWQPGFDHPFVPNVIAEQREHYWTPAPGYDWLDRERLQTIQREHGIIGVTIEWNAERGLPRIATVSPSGPADRAGLAEGDFLLEIQGEPATRTYAERIIGPRGSYATLLVESSAGQRRLVRVARTAPEEVQRSARLAESRPRAEPEPPLKPSSPAPSDPPQRRPAIRLSGPSLDHEPKPSTATELPSARESPSERRAPPEQVLIEQPRRIAGKQPAYPSAARGARVTGTIVLELTIDEEGAVSRVTVVEGLGFGLTQAAVEAAKSWRFEPAKRNGVPFATSYPVRINFQ